MYRIVASLLVCAVGLVSPASGMTIFSDDFDSENGGSGSPNFTAFTQWTVVEGFVDLIGPGFFPTLISNTDGSAVDLDGSVTSGPPGKMRSVDIFFAPGLYEFKFDLGTAGFGPNSMEVSIGTLFSGEVFTLPNALVLFTTETRQFTVASPTTANIIFDELELVADTGGIFIDNIMITLIPEPSTLALAAFGFAALAAWGRWRKR